MIKHCTSIPEASVTAAFLLTLKPMKNDVLAAAQNALTVFGNLCGGNIAFEAFQKADLINEMGECYVGSDVALMALNVEVVRRLFERAFK